MAEADTEAAVAAVSMEEVEEVASTVVVEAADSMEAVLAAVPGIAVADPTEAIAADPAARAEAWAPMDAAPVDTRREDIAAAVVHTAPMAADAPMAHMAERVRMAHTAAVRRAARPMRETAARDRVRGVRIR